MNILVCSEGEIKEYIIPSITIIEGMFVKELDLIPAVYVFKAEFRKELEAIQEERKKLKAEYEKADWALLMKRGELRAK